MMMIWALLGFLLGLALHILAQVDAVARAANNPNNTWLAVLKARAISYIVRSGLALAVFMLWLEGGLVAALMATGITLPDMAQKVLALHVTGALAVLAGYCADSALGYLPFVKNLESDAPKS
jgi:hypothetical protein